MSSNSAIGQRGKSMVFSDDTAHAGGGHEMDEVARSWPQLMALLSQLARHIHSATADGSVKLNRRQWNQVATEARDLQQKFVTENAISRAWYQARVQDYQREAAAVAARARAGASQEQQATDTAYLSGLRASIEHTVHQTALSVEERGQVVQSLDAVQADPSKPVAGTVFGSLNQDAAVRARYAAAASEHQAAQHRERLDATAKSSVPQRSAEQDPAGSDRFAREATQRLGELAERIERLEQQITGLRETATATTQSNGHAKPRQHTEQAAEHSAGHHAVEHEVRGQTGAGASPRAAHADTAAGQNGHATAPARGQPHAQEEATSANWSVVIEQSEGFADLDAADAEAARAAILEMEAEA